ncbi:hypothetical protein Bca4012_043254 [Brassica carinata]
MELLAGNCRKRVGGDFDKMLTHSMSNSRNDDVLATLAGLASPPQKLEPIRCVVKPLSQDKHPLDILAGAAASRLLWDDVEESGQLTRGFAKGELEMEIQGRVSRDGTSWDVVSLSSSVDRDEDYSPPEKMHNQLIKLVEIWSRRENTQGRSLEATRN